MLLPKKISALPGVSTIKNADLFAIVQDGVTSNVTFAILESIISGFTASADTYVTGGVYNSGTTSIDFTGNTDFPPFSVNVSGLTGTFTGNTSGDCITDLYITNLHGCSPITVHDSIQHFGSLATGINSIAWGTGTTASGNYSHSEGVQTTASTISSHAEGGLTIASGEASHSEGGQTIASGNYSHAEGAVTKATGGGSHAEGSNTTAGPGTSAHAEGSFTEASGDNSHAEGAFTEAIGEASHSEGSFTDAIGGNSHAEGNNTIAGPGDYSHAEGHTTLASGDYCHSEGSGTTASGVAAHAEGDSTIASGVTSHAEGYLTKAYGDYSHAEGNQATAIGAGSHAGGHNSIATGTTSFIHSTSSLVTGERSVVLGGQNITGTTDDTVYVPNLNIGTVGGGTPINNLGIDSDGYVVDSGVSIQEAKLVILSGDVLQLNSIPQQIIAAPGVGKTIDIISCMGTLNFATTGYTHSGGNSRLGLQFLGASAQTMEYPSSINLLHSTVTRTLKMTSSPAIVTPADDTQVLENTPLNVSVSIGNPTGGDSDITIYVTYRILTL